MFKTGTTSLGKALEMSGYKTLHGPCWITENHLSDSFNEKVDWKSHEKKIKAMVDKFDAFHACSPFKLLFLSKEFFSGFAVRRYTASRFLVFLARVTPWQNIQVGRTVFASVIVFPRRWRSSRCAETPPFLPPCVGSSLYHRVRERSWCCRLQTAAWRCGWNGRLP